MTIPQGTPVRVITTNVEPMPAIYVRHKPDSPHPHIVAIDGRVRLACKKVEEVSQ